MVRPTRSRGKAKAWYSTQVTLTTTPNRIQMMLAKTTHLHRVHTKTGICACGRYAGATHRDWVEHVATELTNALLRFAQETKPGLRFDAEPTPAGETTTHQSSLSGMLVVGGEAP